MLDKKQIIQWVQALGTSISKETLSQLFQDDKTQSDNKIGHGQFRELAALCSAAECYEEIELLVKYNTAKAKQDKSWAMPCGNKKFGDLIVESMKQIKSVEQNTDDVLTDLMHFFGYLYWQSRVWSAENPAPQKDPKGQYYRDNNYKSRQSGGYDKQNSQHKGGYK